MKIVIETPVWKGARATAYALECAPFEGWIAEANRSHGPVKFKLVDAGLVQRNPLKDLPEDEIHMGTVSIEL